MRLVLFVKQNLQKDLLTVDCLRQVSSFRTTKIKMATLWVTHVIFNTANYFILYYIIEHYNNYFIYHIHIYIFCHNFSLCTNFFSHLHRQIAQERPPAILRSKKISCFSLRKACEYEPIWSRVILVNYSFSNHMSTLAVWNIIF